MRTDRVAIGTVAGGRSAMIGASGRATLAIVRRQARRDAGPWVLAVVGAVFGLFVLPALAATGSPPALQAGIAAMAAAGVGGWILLTFRRAQTADMTSLRYFAAPLYGRELARAHAIVPCLAATGYAVGVAAGLAAVGLLGRTLPTEAPALITALVIGQPITALIALSGCLRRGSDRALYGVLAFAAGATLELAGIFGGPIALLGVLIAAVAIGFAALRALGETLARFDPIDVET